MSLFEFSEQEELGRVMSVDTSAVVVRVDNLEKLRRMQVNRLVALRCSRAGQHLIGMVQKITRSQGDGTPDVAELADSASTTEINVVRVLLIGTFFDTTGTRTNQFRRTLETVPDIDAECFQIEGDRLTKFMRAVASVTEEQARLSLGQYTIDDDAEAFLNGNKFFQRHAIIVGSTGSGKSWTTAQILEQVADLPNANAIVFDIHGEYSSMDDFRFRHLRVAGPNDLHLSEAALTRGLLFLPYWLLGYEALLSLFVDRSDQNAPNQSMLMARATNNAKRQFLESVAAEELAASFTADSPVPFDIDVVLRELEEENQKMVPGARPGTEKAGEFNGKLSRLIQRLSAKIEDRRLGFLFQGGSETMDLAWLNQLARHLIGGTAMQPTKDGGIKVIDFSEVPSDILPLIVSMVARLIFALQQWTLPDQRHPISLFCDEAHLYIPARTQGDAADEVSIQIFERLAKEGRKYGVGLVIISQRPSEVNHTVLSQCNNFIAMRLTNSEDQNVIKRLLPDSLGSFGDILPILDVGEALVVGDASLLPTRVRVSKPKHIPHSKTLDFWDHWANEQFYDYIDKAVQGWRMQNRE